MIKTIGFESNSLSDITKMVNEWIENRMQEYGEKFDYIDMCFSSTLVRASGPNPKFNYSIIIIYDNVENDEEMDSHSLH